MKASIVIRTYNEAHHLPDLLGRIRSQISPGIESEVIVVDSGSTDGTPEIAFHYQCQIIHISKEDFTFGRSLNLGCAAASGEVLIFVSGHCIPANNNWLAKVVAPLIDGKAILVYGRQIGNDTSRFSECRIFEKYFPGVSQIPQVGFFCNNANLAMLRSVWQQHQFDESLTGLEDMHLAKQLSGKGMDIGYVADAVVYHLHDETWGRIKNRFEREAIALQHIMPEVHLSLADFLRYTCTSILNDFSVAIQGKKFLKYAREIVMYRIAQYWGSYRGNQFHRSVSKVRKERYFYPR